MNKYKTITHKILNLLVGKYNLNQTMCIMRQTWWNVTYQYLLLLCVRVDTHYCVDGLFTLPLLNQAVILAHTEYSLQLEKQ